MNFVSTYKRECLLKGTSPLHAIESSWIDATLNFKFLRIPSSEWDPILAALKKNFTLKKICITIDIADIKSKNHIHTKKLKHLHPFIQSLLIHFSNSQHLTELFLVGIPFGVADLDCLAKGIVNSNSLEHICLAESKIGDEGLAKIIEAVKTKPNIAWLDLRSCGLSDKVGKLLASLVSFQSVTRANAARKAYLSAEDPNLDLMCGLRRLSLSGNTLSDAVGHLALALCEDRWIKAIDLQFCHLKDGHLNQLIMAAKKTLSLVYVDTRNNDGLNPTLVKKLKEVLEFNARKHPNVVIQPIFTPVSDRLVSNRTGQKVVHQDSSSKQMKLKQNLPIQTRHESKKEAKGGSNDGLAKDVSFSQLADPRNDVFLKRFSPNKTELQITQIHDEVISVKAKIATLEEEVRELSIKNKTSSESMMMSSSPKFTESDDFSSPFTRSMLMCLRRLQDLLRELKIISAAPHHCSATVRSQEIQVILDAVYAAAHQFDPKGNRAKSENYKTTENCSPRGSTKTMNYKAEKTGKYSENPSNDFHQVCQGQRTTSDKDNTTTPKDLATFSRVMSSVESLFHGHSPINDPSQIMQDPSAISQQDSSKSITSNLRVNSLKSLQTSLEGLRQQLDRKNDVSLDQRNLIPELTNSRSIGDLTSQIAGSHYSTSFNSFSTSSASSLLICNSSIEIRTEVSNGLPHSDTKQPKQICLEKESIPSPPSSTIDLSSIVDLLGNFSIDDIGSSTLTPP
ncbi:hypothetical protein GHT06_011427 [Daphnia sinensis]|uniref:Centrosomal protein of 78 kDa n=1 Tax=Daphnia sinensis TaxID=1820382 RepID=A0AAD5KTV4_9CRUS|nr:hypothetical protein GHT06_011427 [Daphnia sinensis]